MSIRLKDLILQLEALRRVHGDDILVDTEGCDCVGPCTGAAHRPPYGDEPATILVLREHEDYSYSA